MFHINTYKYIMECYSALRMKESFHLQHHGSTLSTLRSVKRQTQKDKHCMRSLLRGIRTVELIGPESRRLVTGAAVADDGRGGQEARGVRSVRE